VSLVVVVARLQFSASGFLVCVGCSQQCEGIDSPIYDNITTNETRKDPGGRALLQ
jgi:hypothetical protein